MSDIVWQDVLDVASELTSGVPIGTQTKVLAQANRRVSSRHFGGDTSPDYVAARAYYAAHFALLFKLGSLGVGAATSKSEGGVSLSFSNVQNPLDPLLGSTTYGRQYLTLARLSPSSVGFVLGRFGR